MSFSIEPGILFLIIMMLIQSRRHPLTGLSASSPEDASRTGETEGPKALKG